MRERSNKVVVRSGLFFFTLLHFAVAGWKADGAAARLTSMSTRLLRCMTSVDNEAWGKSSRL